MPDYLAAILFPVFAQAQEKARQAVCVSNLKQLSMAMMLYMHDNDERVCPAPYDVDQQHDRVNWEAQSGPAPYSTDLDVTKGILQPYLKNIAVKRCPTVGGLLTYNDTTGEEMDEVDTNYCINYGVNVDSGVGAARWADFDLPTETILFADAAAVSEQTGKFGTFDGIYLPSNADRNSIFQSSLVHFRHQGMADIVWMDGHVKPMRPTYRATGYRAATPEKLKQNNLGDVLRDGCPHGSACVDYYYAVKKPKLP